MSHQEEQVMSKNHHFQFIETFKLVVVSHCLPIPKKLIDNLATEAGISQMEIYLEQLFYERSNLPKELASSIPAGQMLPKERAIIIELLALLVGQKQCSNEERDLKGMKLLKMEYQLKLEQELSLLLLGLDQRADIWGEKILINHLEEAKIRALSLELQDEWQGVQHLELSSLKNVSGFFQKEHSKYKERIKSLLDEVTYNNHSRSLKWVATELCLHVDKCGEKDKELLANFILRASHAALLINQYCKVFHSDSYTVEQALVTEIDHSCHHINLIWANTRFQYLLALYGITREKLLASSNFE